MKNLIRALLIGLMSTSAYSASIVPTEGLACTRDFNAWGNAGRCACPSESDYENRIGKCLIGQLESITTTGQISTELSAIGGETTGIVIQSADAGRYELVLPLRLKEQLEQAEVDGVQYTVQGDYLNIEGVESGDRPTIIVNDLTPLNQSSN